MLTPASHIWKPSTARTVVLDAFVPVPRGSTAVAPPPLNWPTKDPQDILDYQFDISPALAGNDGDSIVTLNVTTAPSNSGDLVVNQVSADGASVVIWLSEGQAGTIYTVTILIGTVNGRCIQRSVLLPVLELSIPLAPSTAILTNSGAVLTDQNGNPVLSA